MTTHATTLSTSSAGRRSGSRAVTATLWAIQALLCALFLFAGGAKLSMPAEALAQASGVSGTFLHFIAACEILGALGLVLPGALRIRRELTPLAATGLVTIMTGATVLTLAQGQGAMALLPAVTGTLAVVVALGRRAWIPGSSTSQTIPFGVRPAEATSDERAEAA